MKRILTTAIIMGMLLCTAGCSNDSTSVGSAEATASAAETTAAPDSSATDEAADSAVNEGEFKTGAYSGNSAYSTDDFSMTWVYTITFGEDGTFTLTDDAGEEKGAGTYVLTDDCYTMTYNNGSSCSFVVQADGTLKVTTDLPYGQASISPDMVGGIVLNYSGEAAATAPEETPDTDEEAPAAGDFSITAGAYSASYTKESPMAGTVVYNYNAEIGADTFSYSVSFDMGGTMYDGSSASGTYTIDGDKFVFTGESGAVTEGTLTADNTLVISLMASEMAKEPYEVTFVVAE